MEHIILNHTIHILNVSVTSGNKSPSKGPRDYGMTQICFDHQMRSRFKGFYFRKAELEKC